MEAGLGDHVWSVEELIALLPKPVTKKRGPYKRNPKSINLYHIDTVSASAHDATAKVTLTGRETLGYRHTSI
jgi:hypothetical protein